MRSNGPHNLCVGFKGNFFCRNGNFREILFLRFPPCHVLKLVRVAEMFNGASQVADGNQPQLTQASN
jgi:hypothetical protein